MKNSVVSVRIFLQIHKNRKIENDKLFHLKNYYRFLDIWKNICLKTIHNKKFYVKFEINKYSYVHMKISMNTFCSFLIYENLPRNSLFNRAQWLFYLVPEIIHKSFIL